MGPNSNDECPYERKKKIDGIQEKRKSHTKMQAEIELYSHKEHLKSPGAGKDNENPF